MRAPRSSCTHRFWQRAPSASSVGTRMTIATFGGRPRYFFIIVAEVKFDLLGIEMAMHSLGPPNRRTQCTPEYLLLKQAAAVPRVTRALATTWLRCGRILPVFRIRKTARRRVAGA